jgi:hypothetical protein
VSDKVAMGHVSSPANHYTTNTHLPPPLSVPYSRSFGPESEQELIVNWHSAELTLKKMNLIVSDLSA